MLVLSRKKFERIHIGDDVVISIEKLSGSRVSIGITAPRDVKVVRGELRQVEIKEASNAAIRESD